MPDQVPQLVQKGLGIFQIWRVETLDEPAVNWLQKRIGLNVSTFVVPMPCEVGGGAQLPPTGLLLPRNRQCPLQFSLRLTFLAQAQENLSPQTIQFGFEKPFACCFGHLNSFVQQIKANFRLAEARVGRSDMAQIKSATVPFRVAFGRRDSASHKLDAQVGGHRLGLTSTLERNAPCDR